MGKTFRFSKINHAHVVFVDWTGFRWSDRYSPVFGEVYKKRTRFVDFTTISTSDMVELQAEIILETVMLSVRQHEDADSVVIYRI